MIEHKPGEIFIDNEGGKHVCIETDSSAWMACEYNCSLVRLKLCSDIACRPSERATGKGAHYERVEE